MTSVLVTGAAGLLGTWLRRTAPDGIDVVGLVRRQPIDGPSVHADLLVADEVRAAVVAARPDVLVHTAYAHDEPSIVTATAHVCAAAAANGVDLVHMSTDAVFSGDGRPRDEDAEPDPSADYGRWKAAAERRALAAGGTVVRLPLLVSIDPPDHILARVHSSAAEGTPATWFTDELRRPAWTEEVAAAIWRIVGLPPVDRHGCWHLAGPERLSRYELARRLVEHSGEALPVVGAPTPPGSNRPRDLELTDERARRAIGRDPSPI
jgi:dTDP-4-dehydrorhamnose reductase